MPHGSPGAEVEMQKHHPLCPDGKHPWKLPANCRYCEVAHKATLNERRRVRKSLIAELDGSDGGYADGINAALSIVGR